MSIHKKSEFLEQVAEVARFGGWLVYHTLDSRRSAPGFPDLVCLHRSSLRPIQDMVVAELKVGKRQPTQAQREWLDLFARVPGVHAYLWRPADWDEIERVLLRHEFAKAA